jgi:hypothetical protein
MIPVLRKLLENLGLSHLKKSQIAIATAVVASLLSISLSSSAIAAPDNQVFKRQESSLQDLEMHLERRVRLELETEIQLQRGMGYHRVQCQFSTFSCPLRENVWKLEEELCCTQWNTSE